MIGYIQQGGASAYDSPDPRAHKKILNLPARTEVDLLDLCGDYYAVKLPDRTQPAYIYRLEVDIAPDWIAFAHQPTLRPCEECGHLPTNTLAPPTETPCPNCYPGRFVWAQLAKGTSRAQIVAELAKVSWPQESAKHFVAQTCPRCGRLPTEIDIPPAAKPCPKCNVFAFIQAHLAKGTSRARILAELRKASWPAESGKYLVNHMCERCGRILSETYTPRAQRRCPECEPVEFVQAQLAKATSRAEIVAQLARVPSWSEDSATQFVDRIEEPIDRPILTTESRPPSSPPPGQEDRRTSLMNALLSGQGQPVRELLPAFAEEWGYDEVAALELVMMVALIHEGLDQGQALRRVLKELSESNIHLWRHKAAYFPYILRATRLESWLGRRPKWARWPALLFVALPVFLFLRLRVWLSFSISEMRRRGS